MWARFGGGWQFHGYGACYYLVLGHCMVILGGVTGDWFDPKWLQYGWRWWAFFSQWCLCTRVKNTNIVNPKFIATFYGMLESTLWEWKANRGNLFACVFWILFILFLSSSNKFLLVRVRDGWRALSYGHGIIHGANCVIVSMFLLSIC